jgi:FRG domain-containing protein
MAIVELQAANLQELVSKALEIRTALVGDDAFLWYRGQSCHDYSLLPKLLRDGKTDGQITEREKRLLTRFRQRSMAYWPKGYPQNDWEHLFAMQHYGLPTRLLDWSENLFVAAYFALSSTNNHSHNGDVCKPHIWCIDPVRWNRSMPGLSEYGEAIRILTTADDDLDAYRPETQKRRPKSPVAIFGAHNSERIVAQRGTFMVWGNEAKPLEEVSQDFREPLVWRITLSGGRDTLYQDLQSLGFSETMVFPELTYLATELTRAEGWRP